MTVLRAALVVGVVAALSPEALYVLQNAEWGPSAASLLSDSSHSANSTSANGTLANGTLANATLVRTGPSGPPPPPSQLSQRAAFFKSLFAVSIAEVFDKTWFVTLFMAIPYSKVGALVSSFIALALHTFIAAGLGIAVSAIPGMRMSILHFIAAAVMALYTIMYAYDAYTANADDDMVEEAKAEVDEELKVEEVGTTEQSSPGGTVRTVPKTSSLMREMRGAFTIFLAVFVAEWADRTQVVMVALQASLPHVPVILGSLVAFLLLCLSAVILAAFVAALRISKRYVNIAIASSFVIFTGLSFYDGLAALAVENSGGDSVRMIATPTSDGTLSESTLHVLRHQWL